MTIAGGENINTYGELLAEIERTEKAIEEIQSRPNYEEFEDDVDFKLKLIHLNKVKEYNEQRFKVMKRFGVYNCENCESVRLDLSSNYDIRHKQYDVEVVCKDCGHEVTRHIPECDVMEAIPTKPIW